MSLTFNSDFFWDGFFLDGSTQCRKEVIYVCLYIMCVSVLALTS